MEYNFSDVRIEKLDTIYVASSYVISDNPEADVINFMTKWMEDNNLAEWVRLNGYMPDCSKGKAIKERYWLEGQ